jgi:hypothetical protein
MLLFLLFCMCILLRRCFVVALRLGSVVLYRVFYVPCGALFATGREIFAIVVFLIDCVVLLVVCF